MHGIEQAKADIALLDRLNGAADRLAALTTLQADIIAQQGLIYEQAAKARQDAAFAKFSTVDITDKTQDEHVIRSSFEVSYTTSSWDGRQSVPKRVTMVGLLSMPDDLLGYLIERHPGKIPAKIAQLAADPYEAFERYFIGMKRGHLIGNAYDTNRAAQA
ncbi:hypothetical protein [Sphingomonas faeni]|uniref:hypothetical protein n=1 Tax=Sphingomonas faeni TaxID=185950 RepID=UPI002FE13950